MLNLPEEFIRKALRKTKGLMVEFSKELLELSIRMSIG